MKKHHLIIFVLILCNACAASQGTEVGNPTRSVSGVLRASSSLTTGLRTGFLHSQNPQALNITTESCPNELAGITVALQNQNNTMNPQLP